VRLLIISVTSRHRTFVILDPNKDYTIVNAFPPVLHNLDTKIAKSALSESLDKIYVLLVELNYYDDTESSANFCIRVLFDLDMLNLYE
jgi:hypothetical protein